MFETIVVIVNMDSKIRVVGSNEGEEIHISESDICFTLILVIIIFLTFMQRILPSTNVFRFERIRIILIVRDF